MAAVVKKAETIILGGGISGLAAAFYLKASSRGDSLGSGASKNVDVVVLEGSPRLGGWLDSFQSPGGAFHERGTRSIRPVGVVGRNTLDLVATIGAEDQIVPVTRSHPASQNRFIYTEKGLHRLPSSLATVARRQDPFSQSLLARLLREPFAAKCEDKEDETIHDFFSRRLGPELAQYLASPFCRGIFAGDSTQLSMRACFPAIFESERKFGSLILGGLRSKPEEYPHIGTSQLAKRAKEEKWATWTMNRGLQTLPDLLTDWLMERGVEVHRSTPCSRIEIQQGEGTGQNKPRAKVVTEDAVWEADHVVCSTPAQVTQQLLPSEHSHLSDLLGQITSADVAVVNLEYDDFQLPVNGFGYLVPSCVPSDILGVVFDSCAFPELDRRKGATTRLTCMMGGAWFHDLFGDPDTVNPDDLIERALTSIKVQLGVSQRPSFAKVNVLRDCIPQYRLGHTRLVDDIQSYITTQRLPLSLIGASYRGVSVNDCIFQARQTVEKLRNQPKDV